MILKIEHLIWLLFLTLTASIQLKNIPQNVRVFFIKSKHPDLLKVHIKDITPMYYASENGPAFVKTNEQIKVEAFIEHKQDLVYTYYWYIDDIDLDASDIPILAFRFEEPKESTVLRLTVVGFSKNSTELSVGYSQKYFVSRNQVGITLSDGPRSISHSDKFIVKVKFSGTLPIRHCYRFCREPCQPCNPLFSPESSNDEETVEHWSPQLGEYSFIVSVTNLASNAIKSCTFEITDTIHSKSLPYAPIVASILIASILVIGLALHVRYRRINHAETANFNFMPTDYDQDSSRNSWLVKLCMKFGCNIPNHLLDDSDNDSEPVTLSI